MARRRTAQTSKWLWYGLYAVAGYYAYNWYMNKPATTTTIVTVPPGTVS